MLLETWTALSVLGCDMEVKAGAALELVPKGNQVAVNIIFLTAAAFFAVAVWLNANEKNCVLSVVIGTAFMALGGFFWWKSHKNEALKQGHPFTLKLGEGEKSVAVSSDARSLPALDYLKGILGQYSAIFHREPLPEASGTVGADGKPIQGSAEDAKHKVDQANCIAQQQSNAVSEEICSRMSALVAESPVIADLSDNT